MTAFSKNTYSFPLDIKRRTGVKLLGVNGDTANRFIVTLQDAGVNLDLTGLYVRAVFRRSDGVTVLQSESDSPANITKTTGGVVTIDVLNGSFRDGDNDMEIQVLDGDPDTGNVLITSARMLFRVRKELNSDDATESSHEYTVLQQFIDGLGNMTVTVETLAAGSSATAGLIVGDDYSYELALGIPRGANGTNGSDGVGIANIQAIETLDGNYSLKVVMTDSSIYSFPLPFYIKPAGGIPLRDLSAGVQASLGKADSALQQHQSLSAYRTASDQDAIDDAQNTAIAAKYTKPNGGIPTSDIANGAVTSAKIAAGAVTGAKIAANAVENSNLEYMEPRTVKANNTGSEAAPQDVAFGDMTFVAPRGSGFAGRAGFVPAPTYNDREKFLRGDGTWQTITNTGDSGSFTCVYGVTTWADFAAAVQAGKSIKIRDGISYGWADMIDIDNGYASFTIIAGEDYATSWCEFYADGGWMNWTGGALVDANYVQTALAAKQDTINDLETIRSGAAAGATAVQPAALTAYRTASDQDAIDDAQNTAIAAKYTKPSGGIPTSDIANGAVTGYKIGDHEVTPDKLGEMEALRILGNNSLSPTNVRELTGAQVTAMLTAMLGASASRAGSKGLVPPPAVGDNVKFLRGDGSWQAIANMVGASSSAAGAAGLVPAPASGDQTKFLCGDGTWQTVSGGSDNEFVATVGVTTFDELTAAMNAGKILGVRYVNTTSDSAYGSVYTAWLYAFEPGGTADTYSSFTFTATNKTAGGTLYITASPGSNNTTDWEVYDAQPDLAPTQNSLNAVSSGGVYTALAGKVDAKQGTANAGKILAVGSDGNVTLVTLTNYDGSVS